MSYDLYFLLIKYHRQDPSCVRSLLVYMVIPKVIWGMEGKKEGGREGERGKKKKGKNGFIVKNSRSFVMLNSFEIFFKKKI